jgi:hypothetical protein
MFQLSSTMRFEPARHPEVTTRLTSNSGRMLTVIAKPFKPLIFSFGGLD